MEKRAKQREAGQLTSDYSEFFGAALGLFGGAASILHSVNSTEMELPMTTQLSDTRNRPAIQTGRVVRGGPAYKSEQGSDYEPGVSAETAGSQAVFLGRVTLKPGARTRAHVHERHETALYLLSGTCELWTGPDLERQELVKPGDYIYIPANVLHVAVNRGRDPAVFIACRNEATAQESVVLFPEMDRRIP